MAATAETIPLDTIVWDPSIYPRAKWSTTTIERYVDALEAGDEFPPIVIEADTGRLLDGKHRLEAYAKAGMVVESDKVDNPAGKHKLATYRVVDGALVPISARAVPDGMSAKYFAATLSARHGDRMSNADLKELAREEFEDDPTMNVAAWGRQLGVAKQTVHGWVGDIVNRGLEERRAKAWRLTRLGWTQQEVADRLEVSQPTIAGDIKESESVLSDIRGLLERGVPEAEVARRFNLPDILAWAAGFDGLDDEARLKALGIKTQPYDVWQFPSCHDLMGDRHPGRIPGELICHVLYFFTQPGDLVIDPMVGSGTTLDACLLMGRKARGYDIDLRHSETEAESDAEPDDGETKQRSDIERHDLAGGWPETVAKASLVFWDPPYYDKMDHGTIGDDGYIEGSISGLSPDDYLTWFGKRFDELHSAVKPGTRLAFLMSDWDPENAKRHQDHRGIYLWDYADLLRDAGWTLKRQIQAPLSTQQVHPDIVNKFRASRRLARLERYLLVAEA